MEINLNINTELARQILTGFIRSEITRWGDVIRRANLKVD